ncbi:phospholipase D-like domain-containing protein [Streptomyces sp. NBRC 110611]|uniref:phospholipase D-like domain-containing protein n=1 Tax=Streptomyces sp. NBRC 110611 TaxID=1621259 RepID=UPI0015EEEFD1|nr:phospholipase D-like domain-containing protein [Streptomyces sp. NBRC 110611]
MVSRMAAVVALTVGTAMATLSAGTTAQATDQAGTSAGVTTEAVFNNPNGSRAEQLAIVNRQVDLISGAPAGSRIRMAMFYATHAPVVDALAAAHRRGVRVQAVFDNKAVDSAPYRKLAGALGTDASATSWVMNCGKDRGCIGTREMGGIHAIHQNKFLLFSETRGTCNVVVQSSANLNDGRDGTKGWNNALVLTGNDGIYRAYDAYFDDLAARKANSDYYTSGRPPVGSGRAKIHFYPRAERPGTNPYRDPSQDTVATVLGNVRCTGNSSAGTPGDHRTRIRVSMTAISRPYLAQRLAQLDAQGCEVEVAQTYDPSSKLERESLENLLRPASGRYGGVRVGYYCKPTSSTWIHDKYLLVEGNYYNRPDRRVVWTGSHNWTGNSLRQSDETVLQLEDSAVYDAYARNFALTHAATTHHPANGDALTCAAPRA